MLQAPRQLQHLVQSNVVQRAQKQAMVHAVKELEVAVNVKKETAAPGNAKVKVQAAPENARAKEPAALENVKVMALVAKEVAENNTIKPTIKNG